MNSDLQTEISKLLCKQIKSRTPLTINNPVTMQQKQARPPQVDMSHFCYNIVKCSVKGYYFNNTLY